MEWSQSLRLASSGRADTPLLNSCDRQFHDGLRFQPAASAGDASAVFVESVSLVHTEVEHISDAAALAPASSSTVETVAQSFTRVLVDASGAKVRSLRLPVNRAI
jgi:hypothetical protein